MILPDSNVWIYGLDGNLPEHPTVVRQMETMMERDSFLVPNIVELEVIHYIRRRVTRRTEDVVRAFLAHHGFHQPLDQHVVRSASELMRLHNQTGIGSRDAAILHHAREQGATIWTHDQALARAAAARNMPVFDPLSR